MSTGVLLKEAKKGNQEAFGELAKQYRERVYRVIMRKLAGMGEYSQRHAWAEDVTQDVLIEAWEHIDRCDGRFAGFLYDIAHKCTSKLKRNLWRRETIRLWGEMFPPVPTAWSQATPDEDELIERHDQSEALAAAYRQLPPQQSAVFGMWLMGYATAEIAAQLEIEPSTVFVELKNARDSMRDFCLARGVRPKTRTSYGLSGMHSQGKVREYAHSAPPKLI